MFNWWSSSQAVSDTPATHNAAVSPRMRAMSPLPLPQPLPLSLPYFSVDADAAEREWRAAAWRKYTANYPAVAVKRPWKVTLREDVMSSALIAGHLGTCATLFSERDIARKLNRLAEPVKNGSSLPAIVFAAGACALRAGAAATRDNMDTWTAAHSADGAASVFYHKLDAYPESIASPDWVCTVVLRAISGGPVLVVAVCANLHAATAEVASARAREEVQAALIKDVFAPHLATVAALMDAPVLVGITLANTTHWTYDASADVAHSRDGRNARDSAVRAIQAYNAPHATLSTSIDGDADLEVLALPAPPPSELYAHAVAPLGYYALLSALPHAPLQSAHGAVASVRPFIPPERLELEPGASPDRYAAARRTWVEPARTPSSLRMTLDGPDAAYDVLAASNAPECKRPLRLHAVLASEVPMLAVYVPDDLRTATTPTTPPLFVRSKRARESISPPARQQRARASMTPRAIDFDAL